MNIRNLFTLAFICLSLTAVGQTQLNVKAGTNFTQVNESYENGIVQGNFGYHAGLEVRFGDRFYAAPGLYYFQHQSRLVYGDNAAVVELPDYDIKFEGIRIPLLLGGDLIEGENWGLRLYTGPNVSFVFNDNDGIYGFPEDNFDDIFWGLNTGLGVDIGIFTIDLSQEWRLNNTFIDDAPEFRDHTSRLSVGLLF